MRIHLLGAVLFAAALPAQTWYVTPLGAEFFEGNSSSGISFGFNNVNTQSRIQNIDINMVGRSAPILIRRIAWRRNNAANATATARTADVTLIMSHGDFNAMTSTFASNYKDAPVTVFTRKNVNVPDWTQAPAQAPAEFDFSLPFDTPFIYNRQDGLLWEIVVENLSNPASHSMDFTRAVLHAYGDYPDQLAAGCATAAGPMTHAACLRVNASRLEMGFKVFAAPPGASALALIGASDPNLSVPGLCAPLRTNFLAVVPIGTADATGLVPLSLPLSAAWTPLFAGARFYTQVLAPDASQPGFPVALSNALRCPVPLGTSVNPVNIKRSYSTSNAFAVSGSTPEISAVITRFSF